MLGFAPGQRGDGPIFAEQRQDIKQIENPVTRHITLPLRYQADFDDGPNQATKSTFEVDQAVVPVRLNDDWALITRTKLL